MTNPWGIQEPGSVDPLLDLDLADQGNIFEFIEDLSLDELAAVPAGNQPQDSSGMNKSKGSAGESSSSQGADPVHESQSERRALSRIERIREKNRLAQARFRKKQKEQWKTLERQVTDTQQRLVAAQARWSGLQDRRSELVQRVSEATAALLNLAQASSRGPNATPQNDANGGATTGVSLTHPFGPPPQTSTSAPPPPPLAPPACSSIPEPVSPDSPAAAAAALYTSQLPSMQGSVGQTAESGFLFSAPCPYSKPDSQSNAAIVPLCMSGTAMYTPPRIAPRPIASFRACAPIHSDDVAAGPEWPAGTMQSITAYMEKEAGKHGCSMDDVCWFVQLAYEAAPGKNLAVSSTLSSPPCAASFVTYYTVSSIQYALCTQVLDLQRGRLAPDAPLAWSSVDAALPPADKSGKRARWGGSVLGSIPDDTPRERSHSQGAQQNPECIGGSVPLELEGLEWFMNDDLRHHLLTLEQRNPDMCLSCSTNGRAPLRQAVHGIMLRTLQSFSPLLPEKVMRSTCKEALSQVDMMLQHGYERQLGGSLGLPEDVEFLGAVSDLLCAVMMEIRTVLKRWIRQPPASAAYDPTAQMSEAMKQWQTHCLLTFQLGDKLVFRHAPRIIYNLAMDAVVPLMAAYEVDNFTYRIYKDLQLTELQKQQLKELWMTWERMRRTLDAHMHKACADLAAVPSTLHVSMAFLSHVTALSDTGVSSSCLPLPLRLSSTTVPSPDACLSGGGACGGVYANGERALLTPVGTSIPAGMHGTPGAGGCSMETQGVLGSDVGSSEQCSKAGWLQQVADVKLTGQCPQQTAQAAEALRELRSVHSADSTSLSDTFEVVHDPVGILQWWQLARICAAHLLYHSAPFDLLTICQVAATQCQRAQLFNMPLR